MTHFNAKQHEVRHMLESEEFCIVRPLKPQPEDCFTHANAEGRGVLFYTPGEYLVRALDLPYAPGDSVVVKEAFARFYGLHGATDKVVYCADGRDNDGYIWWQFAHDGVTTAKSMGSQNMRPEWSRLTLTVTDDVQVKRVQSITVEEAELSCIPIMDPASDWNRYHHKTPWDSNPWCVVARCKVHRCNVNEIKEMVA